MRATVLVSLKSPVRGFSDVLRVLEAILAAVFTAQQPTLESTDLSELIIHQEPAHKPVGGLTVYNL